jgi:hypothetical protein
MNGGTMSDFIVVAVLLVIAVLGVSRFNRGIGWG